jgi:hypothetical protein
MESVAEIKSFLSQCWGSENHYFNDLSLASGVVYTSGIKGLMAKADCHWLMDAIYSYQHKCVKDESLHFMQFWTLTVDLEKKTAVLICERDLDDVFVRQEIEHTDFPLPEIKIWLERGWTSIRGKGREVMIAMLPDER